MTLITNITVGFMKQRLNKVRTKARAKANRAYKEQKCLAILEIARTCSFWLHPHATRNKGAYLGRFYSPAFMYHDKVLISTHQNKHLNYNLSLNILGIL